MSALLRWIRHQWDRSAALGCVVAGFAAMVLGWLGISGASLPTEQLPYFASGALMGLFLLGIGATLWLSADLRDEWRKLDEIQVAIVSNGASNPNGNGRATTFTPPPVGAERTAPSAET